MTDIEANAPRPPKRRRVLRTVLIALGVLLALVVLLVAGFAFLYVQYNVTALDQGLDNVEAAGFSERQAEIEGFAASYAEGPDNGTPLLLIHGQGSSWEDYMNVLPALAQRYHVYAIDVFGHGQSARLPAEQYTNVRIGELIAAFMEEVIGEPAVVSGHSSGGLIAAWIAANRPDLVEAVILEDPPLFSSAASGTVRDAGGGLAGAASAFLAQDAVEDFQAYYVEHGRYFAFFGGLEQNIVDYALGYLADHPGEPLEIFFLPPVVNVYFRGLVDYDPAFGAAWDEGRWYEGFDTEATLAAIAVPTVLIHANYWYQTFGTYYNEQGVMMAAMDDRDVARAMALLESAELVEVNSGHLVHFERPEDYLGAVEALAARANL